MRLFSGDCDGDIGDRQFLGYFEWGSKSGLLDGVGLNWKLGSVLGGQSTAYREGKDGILGSPCIYRRRKLYSQAGLDTIKRSSTSMKYLFPL